MNKQASTTVKPAQTSAVGPAKAPGAPDAKLPTPTQAKSLVRLFATRYSVDADKLLDTLKDTAFKQPYKDGKPGPEVSNAQMMALLVVSNEYRLNPFTREIYAFAGRGGGIIPIIGVDGWIRIVNSRPELKSIKFDYPADGTDIKDSWTGCTIVRKDRDEPITIREYYSECYRNTDPWNEMPRRMLRHKALIQCARIAFGYAGVYDPDEAERIADAMAIDSTAEDITGRGKPATAEPRRIEQQPVADKPAATAANGKPQQASILGDEPPSLADIQKLLSSTGVPDNELFAHFEIGGFDDLTPAMLVQARDWLTKVQP